MNKISCNFFSKTLRSPVSVTVLLPKPRRSPFQTERMGSAQFSVLWLLHGAFESGDTYLEKSDIEAMVDELSIAVVLPSTGNSFYLGEYFEYITEELPEYLCGILPLSRKRDKNFIGGLSMGGYGALNAAVRKPERYAKVFSMSGAADIRKAVSLVAHLGGKISPLLENRRELPGTDRDPFVWAAEAKGKELPELYIACGAQDLFAEPNEQLGKKFQENGASVIIDISPGCHDWEYWRDQLRACVGWLVREERRE